MKRYLFIFTFICLLFIPGKVSARCSDQEIIRLQKIANNIAYSKTYRENNGRMVFDITLTNVTNDVYLYDFINRRNIYASNQPITLYGYGDGKTVSYTVKSNYGSCRGEVIKTISVTLPAYNSYYNDPLCDGISFKLCNRWYNTQNLSYDDFVKQVKAYRKKLEAVEEPVVEPEQKPTWQSLLLTMFTEYYIYLFIPIIIIAGGSIYVLRKNEEII